MLRHSYVGTLVYRSMTVIGYCFYCGFICGLFLHCSLGLTRFQSHAIADMAKEVTYNEIFCS